MELELSCARCAGPQRTQVPARPHHLLWHRTQSRPRASV